MELNSWMRTVRLTDREMAEKVGGISISGIRKLRYRERGPSIRVAARISEITAGKVAMSDLRPVKRRATAASATAEVSAS